MATSTKAQPAAQTPAAHESAFLKGNASLIQETAQLYKLGANATPDQKAALRKKWADTLRSQDEWRMVKNYFGLCVINHGFEGRLFQLIHDDPAGGRNGRFAEAMRGVANLTEQRVVQFAPFAAERLVDAYFDRFGATTKVADGDLLAAMTSVENSGNRDVETLIRWIESSNRRRTSRSEQASGTAAAIAAAAAEAEGEDGEDEESETVVDPRVELIARLEAAKTRKAKALEAEDGDALNVAKAEIAQLESELAALDNKLSQEEINLLEADRVVAPPAQPVNGGVVTAQPAPASAAPAEEDSFPKRVEGSKLSRKAKDGLIAAFAAGDSGVEKRLQTLLSL